MKATSILSCIFLILNYSCLVCLAQLDDITKATSALTSWEQISKVTADVRDQIGTALEPLQGEFHKMSPKGRYATGVVVGYTSTKFAFKTTVKIAKVSGAAFIVWVLYFVHSCLSSYLVESNCFPASFPIFEFDRHNGDCIIFSFKYEVFEA